MGTSKCFFLVLFFSVVLSFGLLCSASDHHRRSEDPRRRYEDCQRRCQWETRGDREQERCEEQCQRQFRQEQRERQEEEGRRHRHDSNPEDPQRRFEECQQWCQQQGQRQQPQCQQQCRREFEEQREQQEERSHRRHDSKPEDPQRRFEECQQRCQQEGQRQQPQCQLQCQREFQQQREQQEERDPQRRYEECQQRCQQQGQQQQQPQCQLQCLREFQQQREQTQRQLQECQQQCQQEEQRPERKQRCVRQCREKFEQQPNRKEEDEREEWRQSPNPYYFPRRKFAEARFQEDNGNFWVLQKFSQKHHLLKGINEYRVALLEANPNTFVLPHHCDAEKIYIVTNGKGTITFVTHKNKESFNVVPGVVVRIPAGSTVYLVNQDNKKKLTIAVLHRPVNNHGQFEEFFPAGQEQPQSYYRSFSREILEAVFNTRSEQLDKLLHGRRSEQGMFREASQEQIKSLSQGATTPKEKEERFAFNLLAQKPKYSNQHGKFFEACPREFELLQNVDASVVGFDINQGSIFVPHYNSKSTFVVLITEGNGHVEMVCPHLSSQSSREEEEEEEESRSGEYMKVRSQLSVGDVFVVPAGHPVTYVASHNQNLRALAFGLYHQNNTRIFIAGKNNMVRQMDRAAKEIAFGVPSKLIDDVFNSPQESYFVSRHGQKQRGSEESMDNPISSILDIARLF